MRVKRWRQEQVQVSQTAFSSSQKIGGPVLGNITNRISLQQERPEARHHYSQWNIVLATVCQSPLPTALQQPAHVFKASTSQCVYDGAE